MKSRWTNKQQLIDLGISVDGQDVYHNGRLLKPYIDRNGYYRIGFRDNEHKYIKITVHRILALFAFNEIPAGLVVDHKDRNKLNNDLSNLRIVTYKENHDNCDTNKKPRKLSYAYLIDFDIKAYHRQNCRESRARRKAAAEPDK